MRSAPRVFAEKGTFKKPCTASVCMRAFGAVRLRALDTPFMSVTAPVSLFTSMSEQRTVSSLAAAATCSGDTAPSGPGVRRVTS